MMLDATKAKETLLHFHELKLLSTNDVTMVLAMYDAKFAFAKTFALADTLHLHVKVQDVAKLPHALIVKPRDGATRAENAKDGYIKYPFASSGVNVIFSSIPVCDEDRLANAPAVAMPFLDHIGIDLRTETEEVLAAFDATPSRAVELGWRHVQQGGAGKPVFCCHVEVAKKHWLYPPEGHAVSRPIELAFGALKINAVASGCDLRPIDPAHPLAATMKKCGASAATTDVAH